jgi:hypothetical protein
MKINEDKLPIKYILGIESTLEGYPTGLDIMRYEVELCTKYPDRYKGNFTLHAVNKYHFPDTSKDHLLKSISELVEQGLVEQVNSEEGKESYRILINPFE